MLTVDDFHPASDPREQQAMNQVANRLLRGAGNLAGRARMRADTTLRPALDPRGLAIASGERLPEGHSTIARMVPVAVTPGAVDIASLTQAQEMRHHYPLALAGYIQDLAFRFDAWQAQLPARFRALRDELQVSGAHRREPGQLAHLLLGLETFLSFACEVGVIPQLECERHLRQAREVLLGQARVHALAQAEEAPAALFLRYVGDGFAGKRIYLEDKQGQPPVDAEAWGWERTPDRDAFALPQESWRHGPTAQLVGVLDDEWLLLYPEQVYGYIVCAARAAGRTFPIDQTSLIRRLDEAGLIATEREGNERRHKVNVWLGGATKRVLKLRRDAVHLPSVRDDREEREGREGDEEMAPSQALSARWPSRTTGNAAETGKAWPTEDDVTSPHLPGLPALPGSQPEADRAACEEIVEWTQ